MVAIDVVFPSTVNPIDRTSPRKMPPKNAEGKGKRRKKMIASKCENGYLVDS